MIRRSLTVRSQVTPQGHQRWSCSLGGWSDMRRQRVLARICRARISHRIGAHEAFVAAGARCQIVSGLEVLLPPEPRGLFRAKIYNQKAYRGQLNCTYVSFCFKFEMFC